MCPQRSPAEARSASTFSGARGVSAAAGLASATGVAFVSATAEDAEGTESAVEAGAVVSVTVGLVVACGVGVFGVGVAVEEGSGWRVGEAVAVGFGEDSAVLWEPPKHPVRARSRTAAHPVARTVRRPQPAGAT